MTDFPCPAEVVDLDDDFKVGDRVRIAPGWGDPGYYPDGATGTVVEDGGLIYMVEFDADSGAKVRLTGDRTWFADACRLELALSVPMQEHPITHGLLESDDELDAD